MTRHTFTCNLCEAMCGLHIDVSPEGRIGSIRGNPDDVFSRGHICPKGPALRETLEDPQRLRQPMRRAGNDWRPVSWEDALDEAAGRLGEIRRKHGRDAVGFYYGNPVRREFAGFESQALRLHADVRRRTLAHHPRRRSHRSLRHARCQPGHFGRQPDGAGGRARAAAGHPQAGRADDPDRSAPQRDGGMVRRAPLHPAGQRRGAALRPVARALRRASERRWRCRPPDAARAGEKVFSRARRAEDRHRSGEDPRARPRDRKSEAGGGVWPRRPVPGRVRSLERVAPRSDQRRHRELRSPARSRAC